MKRWKSVPLLVLPALGCQAPAPTRAPPSSSVVVDAAAPASPDAARRREWAARDREARDLLKSSDFPGAEALAIRNLELADLSFGADDPDNLTGPAHLLLARLYREQGQPAKAEEHYAFALATAEKVLGPDDPVVATFLTELAGCYEAEGKPALALPLRQRIERLRHKAH